MAAPRFKILDVVEISSNDSPGPNEAEGDLGAIVQIRRYPDARYRYSVAPIDGAFEVAMILDEDRLTPVGRSLPADFFALPGPFRTRERVRVASQGVPEEIAGQVGTE